MITKTLAVVLALLVLPFASAATAFAGTKEDKQAAKKAEFTAEVKRGIAGLGVGKDARIEVRTRDKTKVVGYVGDVNDASFTVVSLESGATTTVQYTDVTKVRGNNLATGWKVAIGIGVGLGVLFIILVGIYIAQGGG